MDDFRVSNDGRLAFNSGRVERIKSSLDATQALLSGIQAFKDVPSNALTAYVFASDTNPADRYFVVHRSTLDIPSNKFRTLTPMKHELAWPRYDAAFGRKVKND